MNWSLWRTPSRAERSGTTRRRKHPLRIDSLEDRLTPTTATQGLESVTSPNIIVVLPTASTSTVSVNYALAGGTATNRKDFNFTPGTLTFAPGERIKNIPLTILNDELAEGNETVLIKLTAPKNVQLAANSLLTYTIQDDDAKPAVSFVTGASTAAEGVAPKLLVQLSKASGETITVNYAVTGGTATNGSDFSAATGTLTFKPGQTSASISLKTTKDKRDEQDETLQLSLSPVQGATLGSNSTYTLTIQDADATPSVSFGLASSSTTEGAGTVLVPVKLSAASGLPVTISYTLAGSASNGTDYNLNNGSLTFNPGETTKNIAVPLIDDNGVETGSKALQIALESPSNALLGKLTTHTLTIRDDDPNVSFEQMTSTGSEANTTATVRVKLSAPASNVVTVGYSLGGTATAKLDHNLVAGTLTFNVGETTKDITIPLVPDATPEANETIQLKLTGPKNALLGPIATHTYTIQDDDTKPTVTFLNATSITAEGTSPKLLVSLSKVSGETITVNYAVTGGTANSGDYLAATGTLTFKPGQTSQTITLKTTKDKRDEADETMLLALTGVIGATLGSANTHTLTIQDTDATPTISFGTASTTATEGAGTVLVPVKLSAASGLPVTINYTLGGTAINGTDYNLANGSLTFNVGETTKNIAVPLLDDALIEGTTPKTAIVALTSPSNTTIGKIATHTVNIKDDDPNVVFDPNGAYAARPDLIASSDSGRSDNDNVTNDTTPTVTINARPGNNVKLFVDGVKVQDVTAEGNATFTLPTLSDGTHTITATVNDLLSQLGAGNLPLTLTIDTVAPPAPQLNLAPSSDSGTVGDNITEAKRVTLMGHSEPNVELSIVSGNLSAFSTNLGKFQIPQVSLAMGTNNFTLRTTDAAGNNGDTTLSVNRIASSGQPDVSLRWNQTLINAIIADAASPPMASRALAMLSAAIYDAVRAVDGSTGYYVSLNAPAGSSPDAAVTEAAHRVLVYLFPAQAVTFNSLRTTILAGIADGPSKTNGLAVGQAVAEAMIAFRENDGWNDYVSYAEGASAGQWQFTPPMYAEGLLPQWADLTPFAMTSPAQFLSAPPPALDSQTYADALNEVKTLGSATSTARTADQTQIARFWADGAGTYTPPGHWNAIASEVALAEGNSLTENARLLAMLNVALGDAAISSWNTKYHYNFWRPVTAIRDADADSNDATTLDENWLPLINTPPFPSYTSGHSTFSGAAATVLNATFGSSYAFSTGSQLLAGVTRSYASFDAAATEAGMSRIYGGIHYSFDNTAGKLAGQAIGQHVLQSFSTTTDTQAPKILLPQTNIISATNQTLTGRVLDNLSGVATLEVQIDGDTWSNITFNQLGQFTVPTNFALNGTNDGQHTFAFRATDAFGNSAPPTTLIFRLDTQAPTLNITSLTNNGTLIAGARLTGTANASGAAITRVTYQFGSGPVVPVLFNAASGTFDDALDFARLAAGSHTLTIRATDAAGNQATTVLNLTLPSLTPLRVASVTPANGAGEVGLTVRPQVVFTRPVNTFTLNANNFYASDPAGSKLPATIIPAADGTFAWLLLTNPMPGASTITVTIDGATIQGLDGAPLDAAGNGVAGSRLTTSFVTVNQAAVNNTTLTGVLVDPGTDLNPGTFDDTRAGPDLVLMTADDVYLSKIANVKVYIFGRENETVYTDANGRFTLTNVPSGNVKLVVDGNTATNAPSGFYFPEMVMDLNIRAGITNTLMGSMGTIEQQNSLAPVQAVYLPRLRTSILKPVANTGTTRINVDPEAAPNLTPEQRSLLYVEVPANSAIGHDGQPLTNVQVGISTVPASLVREMLPPGVLQHTFDITIQAPNVAVFTKPVFISMPNMFGMAPGQKSQILSFDHTTGRLVLNGTMTVSSDGKSLTSDPGSGIIHPGWHGAPPPGWRGTGDVRRLPNPADPCPDEPYKRLFDERYSPEVRSELARLDAENKYRLQPLGTHSLLGDVTLGVGLPYANIDEYSVTIPANKLPSGFNPTQFLHSWPNNMNGVPLQGTSGSTDFNSANRFQPVGGTVVPGNVVGIDISGQYNPKEPLTAVAWPFRVYVMMTDKQDNFFRFSTLSDYYTAGNLAVAHVHPVSGSREFGYNQNPDGSVTFYTRGADTPTSWATLPGTSVQEMGWSGFMTGLAQRFGYTEAEANNLLRANSAEVPQKPPCHIGPNGQRSEVERTGTTPELVFGDGPLHWRLIYSARGQADQPVTISGQVRPDQPIDVFLPPGVAYSLYVVDPAACAWGYSSGFSSLQGETKLDPVYLQFHDTNDEDNDGLGMIAEIVLGTDIEKRSTTGDGISDGAKVLAGQNPLGNFPLSTGVIANLPLQGQAKAIALSGSTSDPNGQTAYVATGSSGLAVVNVSNFGMPLLVRQIALGGDSADVAVDENLRLVAVATGATGIRIVDVRTPSAPSLVRTINVNSSFVRVKDGLVYAAVGTEIRSFDMLTGELLQVLPVGSNHLQSMTREGDFLYTLDQGYALRIVDIGGPLMGNRGVITLTNAAGKIFVGNGIAYVGAGSNFAEGFSTVNVTNPDTPVLLSGVDLNSVGGVKVVPNGSGLALAVGTPMGGGNVLDVVNMTDLTNTGAFLTRFALPATPNDIALGSGIAYIAAGSAGLQVANYRSFDSQGLAPTVSMSLPANADVDSNTAGVQVIEGSILSVLASVNDDVQVRNVELLVNGQVVKNAVAVPFELSAVLPTIAANGSNSVALRVRATDTGGNVGLSNTINVQLVPDTVAPTVVATNVENGSIKGSQFRSVTVDFSETMNTETLTAANFVLNGPNGPVAPTNIQFRRRNSVVQLTYPLLDLGSHTLTLNAAEIRDRAGNALGTTNITRTFTVSAYTNVWINNSGGFWDDANNWETGVVPGPNDDVFIDTPTPVTITHRSGTTIVRSLRSNEAFSITGGTFTATQSLQVNGRFIMQGATLRNTYVSSGSPIQFMGSSSTLDSVTTATDLDLESTIGASVIIRNGLTLDSATLRIGNASGSSYGYAYFSGTQTLAGTGTVLFGTSTSSYLYASYGGTNQTLTVGPNITVRGSSGRLTNHSAGGVIINQGTIAGDDSGGGSFGFDTGVSGGSINLNNHTFDTTGVANAAPQEVYQSYRSSGGTITYTIGGLTPDINYNVRLHFAEIIYSVVGQRRFHVTINGNQVLTNFDVLATAGARYKAVVQSFVAAANETGQITIAFTNAQNDAFVNGIEIISGSTAVRTINSGVLPGGTLLVNPASFTNNGTIRSASTGTLTVQGVWTNNGTITGTGGTLNLGNTTNPWSQNGSINISNSTLNLGGQFTLGASSTFNRSGGNVYLLGLLDNTGKTLTLNNTTGPWFMQGGTLKGGTYTGTTENRLVFNSTGTLDGVTANGDLDLATVAGASVFVQNGLTLNGTLRVGNAVGSTYGNVYFSGSQTLSGNGTVLFGTSTSSYLYSSYGTNNQILTIGPNITVRGSAGRLTNHSAGGVIVNQGTIAADDSGGGSYGFDAGFSGGSVGTDTTPVTTAGVANAAPPEVYQAFRSSTGTITYTLRDLTPNASYNLRLHFAEMVHSASNQRRFNVAINGSTVLTNFDVFAAAGDRYKALVQAFTATASTIGEIEITFTNVLSGAMVSGIELLSGSTLLRTINSGVLPGGTLTINPTSFTNDGTLRSANTGILTVEGAWTNNSAIAGTGGTLNLGNTTNAWTQNGSLTISNTTLNLGGQFTLAASSTFNRTGGNVYLKGLLDNTGKTLALNSNTGPWFMQGGTLKGGTYTGTTENRLVFNSSGTLDGVVANGDLDLATVAGASVFVQNGLTLNGTLRVGNVVGSTYGNVYFSGSQTLSGNGTVLFGTSTSSYLYSSYGTSNQILTIGPNITVRGSAGRLTNYNSGGVIVNQGTIAADDSGGGSYGFDTGFSGGSVNTYTNPVVTAGVANAAPPEVYQAFRFSNSSLTYTLRDLIPNASYNLRLHFAEMVHSASNQRRFNVAINGSTVLTNFDVFAAAGDRYKAVVEAFTATASTIGEIDITFTNVLNGAMVSGIELLSGSTLLRTINSGVLHGGTLTINPASFTNDGTLRSANTGILTVEGTWTNNSVMTNNGSALTAQGLWTNNGSITSTGGTLNLGNTTNAWTQNGSLNISNTTLNLGGQFTLGAGSTFNRTGGMVYLKGLLDNTGKTLALNNTTGPWLIQSGTLKGGTYTSTSDNVLSVSSSGTLDGVTANGDIDITTVSGSALTVQNGLTLNGTLRVGNAVGSTYGNVYFSGSQTLSGNGTVLFGTSTSSYLYSSYGTNNQILTIGPNITVRGSAGQLTNYNAGGVIVNQGTIAADDSGGGSYGFDTGFSGGSVNTYTNPVVTAGVANAAPPEVYQAFRFSNSSLTYTLRDLIPNASYNLRLHFAEMVHSASNQRRFNVAINGSTVLTNFDVFAAAGDRYKALVQAFTATASTIGEIEITFTNVLSGAMVSGIELLSGSTLLRTINSGVLPGGTLTINPASFTNDGTLRSANAGILTVQGVWTNNGSITSTGGTLNLGNTTNAWTQNGSLNISNTTLNLGGQFTLGAGSTFNRTGGMVYLKGLLDNTGKTLALNNTTGPWLIQSGTLKGGTYTSTSDNVLSVSSSGTLDGVTANGDIDITTVSGSALTVQNGLTLNGTLRVGNMSGASYGYVYFTGTQTLGGNGTVLFGKNPTSTLHASYGASNQTLTIGPNMTIRGSYGRLTNSGSGGAIINLGTIVADDSGGGSFGYDAGMSGSSSSANTSQVMSTAGVTNAAPADVYQSQRQTSSTMTYTIGSLTPNAAYTVRLHFAEWTYSAVNQRKFNVSINGSAVLTNFDMFAEAGERYKAIVRSFNTNASGIGALAIDIANVTSGGSICGIEILSGTTVVRTINCGVLAGSQISINPAALTNQGTLRATTGNSVDISNFQPNAGTLTADAGGLISITGAFTQTATGVLNFALAGTTNPLMGRITSTGAATLNGTVNLSVVNGYVPTIGQTLKVMMWASRTGTFNTVNGTNTGFGNTFALNYNTADLTLSVV